MPDRIHVPDDAPLESTEKGVVPYGKKNPFPSPILRGYNLNGPGSEKETYHFELSLEGSGLDYVVGDALGVFPHNPEDQVDEILDSLPFNVNVEVPLPNGGEASLREALITGYDIRSLTPKFLKSWQARSESSGLRSMVESEDRKVMNDFCWGREVIDLVTDYPASFTDGEDFVSVLKKLQPRLYSISSSLNAHPGEVHLTIAIVRYHSHGRQRGGYAQPSFLIARMAFSPEFSCTTTRPSNWWRIMMRPSSWWVPGLELRPSAPFWKNVN